MSETALFIFGMLVFAVALASSIIGTIGTSGESADVTNSDRAPVRDSEAAVSQ